MHCKPCYLTQLWLLFIIEIYKFTTTRHHLKYSECMQTMRRLGLCPRPLAGGKDGLTATPSQEPQPRSRPFGCPCSSLRASVVHTPLLCYTLQFYFFSRNMPALICIHPRASLGNYRSSSLYVDCVEKSKEEILKFTTVFKLACIFIVLSLFNFNI